MSVYTFANLKKSVQSRLSLADWYAEDVQIRLGLATEDDLHPTT